MCIPKCVFVVHTSGVDSWYVHLVRIRSAFPQCFANANTACRVSWQSGLTSRGWQSRFSPSPATLESLMQKTVEKGRGLRQSAKLTSPHSNSHSNSHSNRTAASRQSLIPAPRRGNLCVFVCGPTFSINVKPLWGWIECQGIEAPEDASVDGNKTGFDYYAYRQLCQ